MKKILIAMMLSLGVTDMALAQMESMSDDALSSVSAQGLIIDAGTLDAGYVKNDPNVQNLNEMLHKLIQWDTVKTGELLNQSVTITQNGIATITSQYHADMIRLNNFTVGAEKASFPIGEFVIKGLDLDSTMTISPK